MLRTTITLPSDLATALQREARRRRLPVSAVVREALAKHLGSDGNPRRLPFEALGRSGHRTTAREFDEALGSEGFPGLDR